MLARHLFCCFFIVHFVGCTIPANKYNANLTTLPTSVVTPPANPLVVIYLSPLTEEQRTQAILWLDKSHPLAKASELDLFLRSELTKEMRAARVSAAVYDKPYKAQELDEITKSLGARYSLQVRFNTVSASGSLYRDYATPPGLLNNSFPALSLLLLPIAAIILIAELADRKDIVSQNYDVILQATMTDTQDNLEVYRDFLEVHHKEQHNFPIREGTQPPLQDRLLNDFLPAAFSALASKVQRVLLTPAVAPKAATPSTPSTLPNKAFLPPPDWSPITVPGL